MIAFDNTRNLSERDYCLAEEGKNASLLTTGNGYMGVRGSLEEFGSTGVQGAFIRGYIDEIVEIVQPFCDNLYMKKYYINEEELKRFDKQVSCVNIPDFLLIRFEIGNRVFYPWEGKILSWKRTLDMQNATLTRQVRWQDDDGNITEFVFTRFASYSDKHKYVQRAVARPINHTLQVKALSGVDTEVRTNGQKILVDLEKRSCEGICEVSFRSGTKYGFVGKIITKTVFKADGSKVESYGNADGGLVYGKCDFPTASEYTVEKITYLYTQRDEDIGEAGFVKYLEEDVDFDLELQKHSQKYGALLQKFDVEIDGDKDSEASIRFANYHTIISANELDSVHGISAKGLTGEKYNQFVWWDSEIYQMPIFTHAYPEQAKRLLEYRYEMLNPSRENARKENRRGARYAFVSSVEGKEHVWIYARHPFLQIHINSDVAFGVIDYFRNTGDLQFMQEKGMEMLYEIAKYWIDRVTYKNGRYEILNVTGTDEHHPYVDNDAYTNYETAFIMKKTVEYDRLYDFSSAREKAQITDDIIAEIEKIANNTYLPIDKNGLIPQFDGYFDLSRTLQVEGNGSGTNFQMKEAGLYHLSQVIKQPDVMLLFSYLNIDVANADYNANWDYYEKMCESSSSLTFPVHAICSALAGRPLSFINYLNDCTHIDLKDIHKCAYQGVHSGCLAGAWLSVFRGVFGICANENGLTVKPNRIPFWNSVKLSFVYKGKRVKAEMTSDRLEFISDSQEEIIIAYNGKEYSLREKLSLNI
ncbi:MAG: glycoside hydrolase family 65 protein [Clostridia bacterium]|nr:glycoside hydrolase family 65 protein [Clostridia bacterium]